jgi:hypothetical protein
MRCERRIINTLGGILKKRSVLEVKVKVRDLSFFLKRGRKRLGGIERKGGGMIYFILLDVCEILMR